SSYTETFSMVVAEALMCNKPVISTNTAAAELLEHGKYGMIVEVGDSNVLAVAIIRLINEGALRNNYIKLASESILRISHQSIIAKWNQML
ncbi:MAG: glycosyltransferase, partial [Burkholderiales bacterium]|nr:glycosyltransferase [Burkholderiales bacterium]